MSQEQEMIPTHNFVASTQSSAEKITDLIDHVVNSKLEEAAKVTSDMLDFANIARHHAAQAIGNHHSYSEPFDPDEATRLGERYDLIDERVKMLQRKLQMIRAAQAYRGDK